MFDSRDAMTDKPERPPDWSDEEWAEYLAWHESLPEDVEREGSRHAVMIGAKDDVIGAKEKPASAMTDNPPEPGDLLIVISLCTIEIVPREVVESWGDLPETYSILDPSRNLPKPGDD